jgi:hypothetical protein
MAALLSASRLAGARAWGSYCDHRAKRPRVTKILTGAPLRRPRPPGRPPMTCACACARARAPPPSRSAPAAPDASLLAPATPLPTGVVGTIVGDGIAQGTAHLSARRVAAAKPGVRPPRFRYDWARAARLCLYAACIGTPIGHHWFGFLDRVRRVGGLAGESPGLGAAAALTVRKRDPCCRTDLGADAPGPLAAACCRPILMRSPSPSRARARQAIPASRLGPQAAALLKTGLDQALMAPLGMAMVRTRGRRRCAEPLQGARGRVGAASRGRCDPFDPPPSPRAPSPPAPQFFLTVSLLEGKRLQQAVEVVREKFAPTMVANYVVRAPFFWGGGGGNAAPGAVASAATPKQGLWGSARIGHGASPAHPAAGLETSSGPTSRLVPHPCTCLTHTGMACPPSPPPTQLWPAAQVVNFRFVPPEQRILYVNGAPQHRRGGQGEMLAPAAHSAHGLTPPSDGGLTTPPSPLAPSLRPAAAVYIGWISFLVGTGAPGRAAQGGGLLAGGRAQGLGTPPCLQRLAGCGLTPIFTPHPPNTVLYGGVRCRQPEPDGRAAPGDGF